MRLDRMPNWLKALVVLAALVGGLPSAAWAHAGHEHDAQSTDVRQSLVSELAVGSERIVFASAFHRSPIGGTGAPLPCCCQGVAAACPSSSTGTSMGVQTQAAWDLAALARLTNVIFDPGERCDYAAPHYRLDRPPKA